jgi:LacI family transcriptional regulator
MLAESRVAGVLFVGGGLKDRDYRSRLEGTVRDIHAYGGHVVALGPRYDRWPGEVPDNRNGAQQVAEHLLTLGHRHIAVISGPPSLRTTEERDVGFFGALRAAGIEPPQALQVNGDFTGEGGASAMQLLLERGEPFTAVFATNDAMAMGCLHVLRERGIRVPEELSLVGFDDIPVAGYLNPPLTTVALEMRQIGVSGMWRLQALLAGTDRGARTRTHPTKLVVRESTAPLRMRRRTEVSA